MSGEEATSSEYPLPLASRYFDNEFIASAPLDEGEKALFEWLEAHVNGAVTQFDKAIDRDKDDTRNTQAVIWEYVEVKHSDYKWRINPDDIPEGLPPDLEQFTREFNREDRRLFNASFQAGVLDEGRRMLDRSDLRREAYVIDELFKRAESASGVIVVPLANRLTPGQR